jgi:hypothetical protein
VEEIKIIAVEIENYSFKNFLKLKTFSTYGISIIKISGSYGVPSSLAG